ncbi:unnamed protein product [Peniophora sp. CBMAI 1063]|nr:unnamed protein product [Peniophora sp. CBMAI 1063]
MTVVDDYQSSDILGGKSPVGPGRVPQGPFTKRNFFILTLVGLVGLVVFYQFRAWFRKYQEERRRLAYRRRNGIPDSDHRAFNVAYAAAQRAKENGTPKRPLFPTLKEPSEPRVANGGDLRQRSNNAVSNHASQSLMAPMGGYPNGGLQPAWESRPSFPQQPSPQIPGYLHGLSSTDLSQYQMPSKGREESKTASGDSPPQAPTDVASTYVTPNDSPADLFVRKPKRSANPTSDENDSPSPELTRHNKRHRKVSNKYISPSEPADVEMDDISALPPSLVGRGKKRDRAEAGSTMGDEDAAELGVELHRRRRRKHRQSGLVPSTRGQKRDRASDVTSDDESEGNRLRGKSTRRRRDESSRNSSEDAMVEDEPVRVVLDPACKGRKVGDVWELHGKTYKVGPTGRRLTRSFIKTDAPVYNMPADSHHPDRDISREIFIEQWLTDEEYKDASDRQVHAHQSPVKPTISTELARQIKAPLENAGKQMLWQLSTLPSVSSPLKSSFGSLPASPRRSIPGTPLPPPPATPGAFRRVTSGLVPSQAGKAIESPRGPRLSLTKMQKQEREAALYGEIKRKEEEAARKKAEEEEAKRKAMAPPPVPAPTLTPAAPAPAPAPQAASGSLFNTPAAPAKPAETPASTSTPAEPAKSTFAFPSSSGASTSLFNKPADRPADKPAQPAATPSFSFGTTSSTSATAPAAAPVAASSNTSASIPNFFGNRGHSSTPAASTPAAPTPAPAAAPAPEAPKPPALFNFAGAGAGATAPTAPKPEEAKPAQPASAFSFGAKQDTASPFGAKPASSPFGAPQAGSSNAAAQEPAKEAPKPMFNFASTNKPASPAPGATPAADAPKPAPTFSFGQSAAPAPTPAATPAAEPAAPKPGPAFSFGGSGQSAFGGGTSAFGQNKPASPAPGAGANNAFGGASAFGQTKAPSPAPAPAAGASSPFGAFANKPADGSAKPASPFGNAGGAADKGKEAEKPVFSFGGGGEAKAKEADKPAAASPFGFGGAANGAKSAFGTTGGSAFGGGSGSGAPSPFASSSTPAPAVDATAAKPSAFAFGSTSTAQPGASDKPATQSAFGTFGAGTNPNANSSAAPFGAVAQNGGAFGSSAFGGKTSAFAPAGTTPGNATSGTSSPFGMPTPTAEKPAKSASFSFGSTTGGGAFGSSGTGAFGAKPGGGGSFSFGSTATNGEKKDGATAPAPTAFSFGSTEKK